MSGATLCTDCSSTTSLPISAFNPANADLPHVYGSYLNSYAIGNITLTTPKDNINKMLEETYFECSAHNWDGYDALPIKIESIGEAFKFIDKLPITIPMPTDISADPNGYISMEWRKRRGLIFDISFTGENEIIYAGVLGPNKPRGILYLGSTIPRQLIEHIQTIGL